MRTLCARVTTEHGAQSMEHRAWSTEHGAQSMEHRAWSSFLQNIFDREWTQMDANIIFTFSEFVFIRVHSWLGFSLQLI
jgi:hypothetical protein